MSRNSRAGSDPSTVRVFVPNRKGLMIGPGRFHRRLLWEATHREPVLVESPREADVVIEFFTPSRILDMKRSAVSYASRRLGKWIGPRSADFAGMNSLTPSGALWPESSSWVPKLWFTGENIRPPASGWDATFSFDIHELSGHNHYLPIWWEDFDLWNPDHAIMVPRRGNAVSLTDLVKPRKPGDERENFVCAFINNPTSLRLHAISVLSRVGQVDVFGRLSGRRVQNKSELAKKYKFMLCFENDYYPGYVTEKAFDAWASGCIPLWWGGRGPTPFTPGSIVDWNDFESTEAWSSHIDALARDPERRDAITSLPLLTQVPDPTAITVAVREVLRP